MPNVNACSRNKHVHILYQNQNDMQICKYANLHLPALELKDCTTAGLSVVARFAGAQELRGDDWQEPARERRVH